MRKRFLFTTTLLAGALPALAQGPEPFLKTYGTFTDAEIEEVDSGQVVVKTLPSPAKNEVAILGVARVRANTDFFVRMYEDIERFETGWGVTKEISDPPRIEDFAKLAFPPDDLTALKDCKVGDCDFKIGEAALEHFQNEVDWSDPGAPGRVNQFFRERALEYAKGYLAGGNDALGVYADKGKPTAVKDQFEDLLKNSPYIHTYRPELDTYLLDYPKATLSGATDFLYWGLIDFGSKPLLHLSHVTIYRPTPGANENVFITSKHLYYSHYFHTGLDLYTLVKDAEHPDDGFYLVALSRYRTDLPSGLFGKMAIKTAQDSARGSVERYLTSTQAAIGKYFAEERARTK